MECIVWFKQLKKIIGEFQSQDGEYIMESPVLPENHGGTG